MSELAITGMEKFQRADDLLGAAVGEELLMMSIEKGSYFSLNAVGGRIWELLETPISIDELVARLTAESYLHELKQAGIDTLVLGCTHYPLLKPLIAEIMGPDVILVDSAEETARTVAAVLADKHLLRPAAEKGNNHFYVSDIPAGFIRVGNRFLGGRLGDVYQVDLDKDGEEC